MITNDRCVGSHPARGHLVILLSEYLGCPAAHAEALPLAEMAAMAPARLAAELATLLGGPSLRSGSSGGIDRRHSAGDQPGFSQVDPPADIPPPARRIVAMVWALQRDLSLRDAPEADVWREAFCDLLDLVIEQVEERGYEPEEMKSDPSLSADRGHEPYGARRNPS